MTDKLKPCPFCGRIPELRHDDDGFSYIVCANDNCYVKTDGYLNDDTAIKAWNTRKPIDKVVKQLEELQELGRRNECAGGEAACPVTNCEEHYIQLAIEIVKKGGAE